MPALGACWGVDQRAKVCTLLAVRYADLTRATMHGAGALFA